jgi:hypothetical protein
MLEGGPFGRPFYIEFAPYTILAYDDNFQDTGGYNLNLQFLTGRCAAWLPCSESKSGTIPGKASMATFGFGATAGQAVTITGATSSGTLCTRLNLYNPSGGFMASTACNSGTGPITLPATGAYTILAFDDNFQDTGAFNVSWRFTTGCPACTLSATGLNFASQLVGTTSQPKSVTLTNTGTATMTILKRGLAGANPGDFVQSSACGVSIPVGATCAIGASFRPTIKGARSAAISILDNAPGAPHSVSLAGTGTVVKLAPASLVFPRQLLRTQSPVQAVTLTNTGPTALNISSIGFTGANTGDFGQTNTCGASVAANASCAIRVTFTPAATGNRTAALSISDDGGGSPHRVNVSGTGTAVAG